MWGRAKRNNAEARLMNAKAQQIEDQNRYYERRRQQKREAKQRERNATIKQAIVVYPELRESLEYALNK